MMTLEQQRIAIAEWMGWFRAPDNWLHNDKPFPDNIDTWISPVFKDWKHTPAGTCIGARPPDYPNDLNAMHEAEKGLTGEQCLIYCDELNKATKCFQHITPVIMVFASADKRSEALCRTLWPERFTE